MLFRSVAIVFVSIPQTAVASNMLSLFGVDTTFVTTKFDIEGKGQELHAYLLVTNSRGKQNIYDPTHPKFRLENGVVTSLEPFVLAGGDTIKEGDSVEATHEYVDLDPDGAERVIARKYLYTPPSMYKNPGYWD